MALPSELRLAVSTPSENTISTFSACGSPCCARKFVAKMNGVEQRSQSAGAFSGESIRGVRRAAVACAKLSRLRILKREHCQILLRNASGLRNQFQRIRHFLSKSRAHRLAGVNQNCDFKFCPVGSGKALEIADDNIFVNDRKVIGL